MSAGFEKKLYSLSDEELVRFALRRKRHLNADQQEILVEVVRDRLPPDRWRRLVDAAKEDPEFAKKLHPAVHSAAPLESSGSKKWFGWVLLGTVVVVAAALAYAYVT